MLTAEQQKLVTQNHNLIYGCLKKYNLSYEEYYDVAAEALCKASTMYNPELSTFSTYAYRCMRNLVLKTIRDSKTLKRQASYSAISLELMCENENETKVLSYMFADLDVEYIVLEKLEIQSYIDGLSETAQQILYLSEQGYSIKEIMNRAGCSKSYIHLVKNNFKEYIKNNYN